MAQTKPTTKPKAKGWARKKANRDTRQEILDAAALAWSRDGFEGVGLAEIAKQVGIRAPSLYNHFKSKNEILFTLLGELGKNFHAIILEQLEQAGDKPADRLAAMLRQYVLYELDHIAVMPLVNSFFEVKPGFDKALRPAQRQAVIQFHREVVDMLRDILEAGKEAGDFEFADAKTVSFALLGMAETPLYWFKPDGQLQATDIADRIVELALKSVANK